MAGPSNRYHYNPYLKEKARTLRSNMTKSEVVLWKHGLRAGQMMGLTFNRQRPVLDYIADFMCKEILLIIEIDGISHHFSEVSEKDVVRQERLEEAGFTVLRIPTGEVLQCRRKVIQLIQRQCEVLKV
ncbi:MAG: DUF559 domain-containing protein [Flavobacteriales bacterium]|nr:DUF559 domain-containing protein [Flavobacteriales bacterium]